MHMLPKILPTLQTVGRVQRRRYWEQLMDVEKNCESQTNPRTGLEPAPGPESQIGAQKPFKLKTTQNAASNKAHGVPVGQNLGVKTPREKEKRHGPEEDSQQSGLLQ